MSNVTATGKATMVRRWEKAAEVVLDGQGTGERTYYEILNVAGELDRLERQLAENARHMESIFARAATEFAAGQVSSTSDPTGYSALRSISEDVTRHQMRREHIRSLIVIAVGQEALDRLNAILSAKAVA